MPAKVHPPPPPVRCAIYTRKSTAAGLDQAFNSLDAQREACARYIEGQARQNWKVVPEPYSDGGFTGATIDRPGFQKLLADISQRKVEVVVVYKVDRLSRSLLDFAKVMEVFTQHQVAFVSVTQNFSTVDAMGRLTLNMLMSFAEFEREMIVERVRDKIGAARRKGRWTGGIVPLGYDVVDRKLQVNEVEAQIVREVFARYLEVGSAVEVAQWLNDRSIPLKSQVAPRSRPWTKDLVLRLLRKRLYLGLMHSRGVHYPGEHPAIVDPGIFEGVQACLDPKKHAKPWGTLNPRYLIRGALRCGACGSVMCSTTTHRRGREYRYYRCIRRGKEGSGACTTRQVPADAIESFVVDQMREAMHSGRISKAKVEIHLGQLKASHSDLLEAWNRVESDPDALKQHEQLRRQMMACSETIGEMTWLADTLTDFDTLWELLNPLNRQRLVRALVQEVVIQEREGRVQIRLVDLDGDWSLHRDA